MKNHCPGGERKNAVWNYVAWQISLAGYAVCGVHGSTQPRALLILHAQNCILFTGQ